MPGQHFFHPKEKYYVTTNFKVMYSFLNNNSELRKVNYAAVIWNTIQNHLGIGKKHYFIVRPVESRLVSFYKNKFIRHSQELTQLPKSKWQNSLKLFFASLGIDEKDDAQKVIEQLKQVQFNDFIQVLPDVYLKDGHLRPQTHALKIFGFPLHFNKILNMENTEDYELLSTTLQLDTKVIHNSTKEIEVDVSMSKESKELIQKLYAKDFLLLQK